MPSTDWKEILGGGSCRGRNLPFPSPSFFWKSLKIAGGRNLCHARFPKFESLLFLSSLLLWRHFNFRLFQEGGEEGETSLSLRKRDLWRDGKKLLLLELFAILLSFIRIRKFCCSNETSERAITCKEGGECT